MVDELPEEKRVELVTIYLVLISATFLLSIFLFSSLSNNILKTFVRMGITPLAKPQTFNWTIKTQNLKPGSVIAYKSYAQGVDGEWSETELKMFSVGSASSISTTTIRPTTGTTIPQCNLERDACKTNENCCYGYCCDGFCSSSECKEPLGLLKYLIAIPVFVVIGLIIVWMRSSRRTEEDEFERLKEKWSRGQR
jgi:hypothetical protein